jgi:hypothetical protein
MGEARDGGGEQQQQLCEGVGIMEERARQGQVRPGSAMSCDAERAAARRR